jgi:hypothetical protein
MPRCCAKIEGGLKPSYASVLVAPDLEERILALEQGQLLSNITTWCQHCKKASLIVDGVGLFQAPSEYYAHILVLASNKN